MAQIQGRAGNPPFSGGKQLAAGYGVEVAALAEKLNSIGFHGESAIAMAVDEAAVYRTSTTTVKVETLTGKVIEVEVEPTEPVVAIKQRVEAWSGIPPEQQRLVLGGKQLDDGKTVQESNITAGARIHLVLALKGG